MRVLLGMSGGVDSSAAAVLLKKEYDVCGVTLSLYSFGEICKKSTEQNIFDAAEVCKKIGINHSVLDLSEDFKNFVITPFCEDYKNGFTPNPCINCNRFIKFGEMLAFAESNGFDKIATGHYAQVEEKNGEYYLKKAADKSKDQTYVLYGLTKEVLSKLLLPLGNLTKEECRKVAENENLINAHKSDSQDICFVPDGDYGAFIENIYGVSKCGNFIDKENNILGEHKGIIHYTVGQRKGLGIALGKPAFVTEKNASNNTVTLSTDQSDLECRRVYIKDINFINRPLTEGEEIEAKLRYSQKCEICTFHTQNSGAFLEFVKPQRAPTPGQAAVFYKGDYCLGGGTIIKGE